MINPETLERFVNWRDYVHCPYCEEYPNEQRQLHRCCPPAALRELLWRCNEYAGGKDTREEIRALQGHLRSLAMSHAALEECLKQANSRLGVGGGALNNARAVVRQASHG